MMRRLAYFVLSTAAALAIVHCSSTAHPPPSEVGAEIPDASGTLDDASKDVGVPQLDANPLLDAGAPEFTSSRASLDFGLVGCARAGVPITLSIRNTGSGSFSWSSTLRAGASSLFTLTPATGTLAAGAAETVTVSMGTVPYPGRTDADFYGDTITVLAKGAGTTTLDIPVKLTAQGAIVRFSPTAIVFGGVPLNETSSASFGLVNEGNADVELNLVSNNGRFAPSPLGPVIVPKGATAARTATFSATDTTPQTGELALSSTNPGNTFCAPVPALGLGLSGVGSNGSVNVTPAAISFGSSGLVDCGTQAPSRTVTVQNTGNAPFNWTAKLSSGASSYTLSPSSGTVQAATSGTLQIVPLPIPQASAVTSDLYAGTVEVTTTAVNDPVHIIQLHETARGAILTSTVGATLDFGAIKVGTTSSLQFSVTNNGNVATTVDFAVGSASYSVTPSASLGPNQTSAPTVSFSPGAVQSYTDTLVTTTNPGVARCAPVPDNATLSGSGTTAVSVEPTSLNFGLVNCGTTAAYQILTIKNTGPAMSFVPTLGKDLSSPYTLANDATAAAVDTAVPIALASGASYTLRIIPAAITPPASTVPDAFGDTLTITTNSPGDAAHVIQLNETARGAFLSLVPLSLSTTDDQCNHVTFNNFSVVNSGNVGIGYSVAAVGRTGTPNGTFVINIASGSLFGGQSQAGILEIKTPPLAGGGKQYLGDLVLTPGAGLLCSDAQPKAPLAVDATCGP
jgi:Viral BACON domain